jgi:hypothetical protein
MVLRVDPPVARTKFGQKSTSNSIGGMVQSLPIAMVFELYIWVRLTSMNIDPNSMPN